MRFRMVVPAMAVGLVAVPAEAPSCSPVFIQPLFSWKKTPADYSGYIQGKIGVLEPSYERRYHVIAYRYFTGVPLTKAEIASPEAAGRGPSATTHDGERWNRGTIVKFGDAPVAIFRSSGPYSFYRNCTPSTFETAQRTLNARTRAFGRNHPGVKGWIQAQEVVFVNCGEGQYIPAPAESGLPAIFHADREYQIAAAYFYSESYDQAYERFRRIAMDRKSPWSSIAPYLAVRCLIRETSLELGDKYEQALKEIDAILAEPRYLAHHESARGLRTFILLRTEPQKAIDAISQALRQPARGARFRQNLIDYEYAWLRRGVVSRDDMGQWIQWMAGQRHADALTKWRAGKQTHWLVAALLSALANDAAVPELIAAAEAVPDSSYTYATVLFHKLRLLEERGQIEAVRRELDREFDAIRASFPVSSVNRFLEQRTRVAGNLDEFLGAAQRRPVALIYDRESESIHPFAAPTTVKIPATLFGPDAVLRINRGLPLSLVRSAALDRRLPEHLAGRLASVAFARAAVLGQHDSGRELGETIAASRPSLQGPVKRYRNATTDAERKFAAAFILLRSPGLSIDLGPPLPFRDEVVLRRIDDFRQNWWCAIGPNEAALPAPFLTADERRAFDAEWQTLRAAGAGPTWMGARAVEWAKSHPSDPAAPEALHLTVRATRYGCADARNSEISRAAFALLHSRWPQSEWAAKTPYWF